MTASTQYRVDEGFLVDVVGHCVRRPIPDAAESEV